MSVSAKDPSPGSAKRTLADAWVLHRNIPDPSHRRSVPQGGPDLSSATRADCLGGTLRGYNEDTVCCYPGDVDAGSGLAHGCSAFVP
jgi:hypothetical protein